MNAQLAAFEEDKKQYQEQLDLVLVSLKDDPNNAELLALKDELTDAIKLIDETIADIKPKRAAQPPPPKQASPSPVPEKWSRENHPAFKKAAQEEKEKEQQHQQHLESTPVSYQVNDTVLAKWVSGDKGFYPARITSVTGSSTDPIYTVKFKSYDTVETLRSRDIKSIAQKRKAPDSGPAAASSGSPSPYASGSSSLSTQAGSSTVSPGGTPSNGIVMTAAASVYPKPEATADQADAPRKVKKIKANKELEAGKNKWQEFNQKSKFAKSHKKDSMFRTPEGVHGRVGFTGSGHPMRKDPTRSRHIYQPNEELD
ncbi:Splicing factor spf30 [Pleurostoma richardsiae]|uniref:Splicing factor spf30 n=1 Tax=Pleurostoma richardsiae TaxID=41990 RepID=A0AA38RM96_9PEZI|nr:Splicing factor spf30 [Pleurostoma richardsiae]